MKLVRCEDWIIRFQDNQKWQTFFRVPGEPTQQQTMLYNFLRSQCPPGEEVCTISLEGIDYMATSAIHELVSASLAFSTSNQIPVVITQVNSSLLQGLKCAPSLRQQDRRLWAIDIELNPHILGEISPRYNEIINLIYKETATSASEITEALGQPKTGTKINNASVYLQKIFNIGLLCREKTTGRKRGTRGWTYNYYLPWC